MPRKDSYSIVLRHVYDYTCDACGNPPHSCACNDIEPIRPLREITFTFERSRFLYSLLPSAVGVTKESRARAKAKKGSPFYSDRVETTTTRDGWTLTCPGRSQEWSMLIYTEFTASHSEYGRVMGDLSDCVTASSDEAFSHFWMTFKPVKRKIR